MVLQRSWVILLSLAAALLVALALGMGSAQAQGTDTKTLQLTPSRDSGVSGTATLTDTQGGVEVKLDLKGFKEPGVQHLAHIHQGGTCADDRAGKGAPVKYPLTSVEAKPDGTGSSTTVIKDVTVAQLFDGSAQRYINVHNKKTGDGVPPGVACADLTSASSGATSGGTVKTMPNTGGPVSPATLLSLGAGALLISGGVFFALRRRSL